MFYINMYIYIYIYSPASAGPASFPSFKVAVLDSHTTRPTFASPEASVITTQGCCGRSSDAERKVGAAAIHTYIHTQVKW